MGQTVVNEVKPLDLENYQETRTEQGMSPATIDMEITISKTMITKAFYNDIIGGRVLKAFNNIKKKLKKGSNARSRTLTFNEYVNLISVAPVHLRAFLIIAFHTGMRRGEIRQLKWSYIDREGGMIRLPAAIVKEKKNKVVPVNYYVEEVLKEQPRALLHDFVITYRGEPIKQPGGLNRSIRTACEKAGVRSRLRSVQLKKWKNPRKLQRMMIRAGYKPHEARRVWVKMNRWQSVTRKEVRFVMNLQWFRRQGMIFLHDFTQKQQSLELTFSR